MRCGTRCDEGMVEVRTPVFPLEVVVRGAVGVHRNGIDGEGGVNDLKIDDLARLLQTLEALAHGIRQSRNGRRETVDGLLAEEGEQQASTQPMVCVVDC